MTEIHSSGEISAVLVPAHVKLPAPKSEGLRKVVQALIAVVAAVSAVFWASRVIWDTRHPVLVAARGLRASHKVARLDAIQQVGDLSWSNQSDAINALSGALADPESDVRLAAARSLGLLGARAMKSGSATEAVKAAVPGLFRLLEDQSPGVRLEAIGIVGSLSVPPTSSPGRGSRNGGETATAAPPAVNLPQLADAYAKMLADQDDEVRLAATRVISSPCER
jgi:HEAT repeat protein